MSLLKWIRRAAPAPRIVYPARPSVEVGRFHGADPPHLRRAGDRHVAIPDAVVRDVAELLEVARHASCDDLRTSLLCEVRYKLRRYGGA